MDLHKSKIHIAAASRTHAPKAARQALTELLIPGSIDSDNLLKSGKAKSDKELVSSINLFDSMEIYPGSKIIHFQALHKKTGIPYEEMVRLAFFLLHSLILGFSVYQTFESSAAEFTDSPDAEQVFFDDESRNREVTKLGVTFVLVQSGVSRRLFESGLDAWRRGLSSKTL